MVDLGVAAEPKDGKCHLFGYFGELDDVEEFVD